VSACLTGPARLRGERGPGRRGRGPGGASAPGPRVPFRLSRRMTDLSARTRRHPDIRNHVTCHPVRQENAAIRRAGPGLAG
jgi:hypothetical protein